MENNEIETTFFYEGTKRIIYWKKGEKNYRLVKNYSERGPLGEIDTIIPVQHPINSEEEAIALAKDTINDGQAS